MRALVLAAGSVSGSVRAFVLLMRHSGLAIQDPATLARARLEGARLTLRRGKSGELVQMDLPDMVVEALAAVPREGPPCFWPGKSQPVTAAKLWARCLPAVGQEAQVAKFRSPCLRDLFAAELLLAGLPLADVSILRGHASIQTTEWRYPPRIRSRRDRLVRLVRKAHGRDLCPAARLRTMDTTEILLAVIGVFGLVFGAVLTFIGSMILYRLKAAEERAKEDRVSADKRAAEDRAANKADHDKLFQLVAGLQADVKVLRDRSDRADRADRSDSAG